MALTNSSTRYGIVTKTLHWLVVLGFVNQFVVAKIMTAIEGNDFALGFSQGSLYNWHKSIGLVILAVVVVRYTWRKTTRLPDWAAGLADWEKRLIHWYERMLYWAMFLMPLSGYLFVESGGFGVQFFGVTRLPSFLPHNETLAWLGHTVHIITGYAIVVFLTLHIGLVLKHQLWDKDRILQRMLPFSKQQ
jgi:cytochrome b561